MTRRSLSQLAVSDEDALLGGLLAQGRVPEELRRRLRPELVIPERRPLLQAVLAAREPFDWQTILRSVYGEDAGAWETRLTLAAAFQDQLPLYLRLLEMRQQQGQASPTTPVEPVRLADVLDGLERDLRAGVAPKALPTGFPGVDRLLSGGLCPGELAFIAAKAGTGKTAFALEWARAAAEAGEPVLVVSREMKNLALARRLLAQASRVDASRIKRARLGDGEWVLLGDALARLRGLPVWLTDAAVTTEQIAQAVRDAMPPFGLVIVDYLQLVRVSQAGLEKRHRVEAVSEALKGLAMEAGAPVVCLSSIARSAGGPDTEPTMESLRESGQLEHDADVIILLARKFGAKECACIVGKNRDGRTGRVALLFREEYVAFEERETRGE